MPQASFNGAMVADRGRAQTNPSLAEWLDAVARQQDRAAFARLFDHFAPRVKGYTRRLGASEQKAEDIV